MTKTRRVLNTKPKHRNTFTVRSLISNRKRNVNFLTKRAALSIGNTNTSGFDNLNDESGDYSQANDLLNVEPRERKTELKGETWQERKRKIYEEWQKLRDKVLEAWLKQEAAIEGTACVRCTELGKDAPIASIRCKECGPNQFFCKDCALELHSTRCIFHRLEEWKVRSKSLYINCVHNISWFI